MFIVFPETNLTTHTGLYMSVNVFNKSITNQHGFLTMLLIITISEVSLLAGGGLLSAVQIGAMKRKVGNCAPSITFYCSIAFIFVLKPVLSIQIGTKLGLAYMQSRNWIVLRR